MPVLSEKSQQQRTERPTPTGRAAPQRGFDPGTGKQIQRSITGKTQKEVAQKLKQVTLDIDNGVYHAPCKLTLAQWLEISGITPMS